MTRYHPPGVILTRLAALCWLWKHETMDDLVSVRLGHKWSYFYNHKQSLLLVSVLYDDHFHLSLPLMSRYLKVLVGNDIYKDSCMRMLIHLNVLFNLIHNIHTKAGLLVLVTMEYAIRSMLQRLLQ